MARPVCGVFQVAFHARDWRRLMAQFIDVLATLVGAHVHEHRLSFEIHGDGANFSIEREWLAVEIVE